MELIATHDGHAIHFGEGSSITEAAAIPLQGLPRYFTCAFFLHDGDWSKPDLEAVIERVLDAGAVHLQFHGKRCNKAVELADSIVVRRFADQETKNNVILTTSHSDVDVVGMAFEVVLIGMTVGEDYWRDWAGYLVVSIGSQADNESVKKVFSNPQKYIDLALNKESR
jgi:hypothetical protein